MMEIRLLEHGIHYQDMAFMPEQKLVEWLAVIEVKDELAAQQNKIAEQEMRRRLGGFAPRT